MFNGVFTRIMAPAGDDAGGNGGGKDADDGKGGNGTGADAGKDAGKDTILGSAGADDKDGDKDAAGAADAGKEGEWSWGENVPGTGTIPPWLKSDKYKTVADQAKAAIELETKLGPAAELIGAPEGDYEMPELPEGTEGEWDIDDAMLKQFNTIAKEMDLSQAAHKKIVQAMGLLLATERTDAEAKVSDALAALGTNSPARIEAVETYLRTIVSDDGYEALEGAIGTDVKAYLALEMLVAKASGDAQLSSLPGLQGPGFTKADIETERYKVYPDGHRLAGKSLYELDKEHRAKVDGMWKELFPGEDIQTIG